MLLSFKTLENFLTSHWATVSIVKQLLSELTRFFARHCPMSGDNIQASHSVYASYFKDTLMQISKSTNILVFIRKKIVEDFTLEHLLLFEICARKNCEKLVRKHSETIEYLKN